MKTDVLEILENAKDILESKDAWIRLNTAVNTAGKSCSPYAEDACCWCLSGAIANAAAAYGYIGKTVTDFLFGMLSTRHRSIKDFNDDRHTSHSDIMGLLEKGIQSCEQG